MTPLLFLGFVLLFTAGAATVEILARRRIHGELQALARELRMAYSPHDRFSIANEVAERFPVPGAAALRVIDLLYQSSGDRYLYVFTAEYTAGVIRSKSRQRRAVSFSEPKGRGGPAHWSPLRVADPTLPLRDQYRTLASATS